MSININIYEGPETEELICNWCGLPHPATPEQKATVLKRGKHDVAMLADIGITITPDQTWTCGACYLYLHKIPADIAEGIQTGCEHAVPAESKVLPSTLSQKLKES